MKRANPVVPAGLGSVLAPFQAFHAGPLPTVALRLRICNYYSSSSPNRVTICRRVSTKRNMNLPALRIAIVLLLLRSGGSSSTFQNSLELSAYLANAEALNRLVIQYNDSTSRALFVFGTGRVVRQAYPAFSGEVVPTCVGKVQQDRVRKLVKDFAELRFFELPQKSYPFLIVSDDPAKDLQLHSIVFDDGTTQARRDFAFGSYGGKTEPVPGAFVAAEKLLLELESEAISPRPCGMAQKLRVAPANR